jgi:hypothetical protein
MKITNKFSSLKKMKQRKLKEEATLLRPVKKEKKELKQRRRMRDQIYSMTLMQESYLKKKE